MPSPQEKLDEQIKNLDPSVASQALILASLSADELEGKNGLHIPKKQYIGQKALEIAKALKQAELEIQKKIELGYRIIAEKMLYLTPDLQKKFIAELTQVKERIVEITHPTSNLEEKIAKYLPCNTFQDVLGFSSDLMEWIYQIGRELFNEKKFYDANGVFRILLSLNDRFPNYWVALGLTEKELHNYEEAILIFSSVILFEPTNASARYNCAELYLELGQLDDAQTELDALSMIAEDPSQESLKPHLEILLQRIAQKKQAKGDIS